MQLDNYHSILPILWDWCLIFGAIYVNKCLSSHKKYLGFLFYPITLLIIGGRMRALANLLHESTHRCLAKSKLWNDFIGTVLSGWCILQSWTGYYENHIVLHHPHLGDPDKDPDFQQMIETGLYNKNVTRADVVNYIKSIPSLRFTITYVKYIVKDRLFPKQETKLETILRMSFWITVAAVLYQTGNMLNLIIFWFIPMLTTANWIGNLAELMEHYPLLKEGVDEMHASRNRFCGTIGDFIFNPHGDQYHLVHHLFPHLPPWNFEKAHAILMEDECYRELHQGNKIGMRAVIEEMLSHFD